MIHTSLVRNVIHITFFFTYLTQFLRIYIISANLDCKKMNPSSCDPKFFLQLYTRIVFSATNSAQCPPPLIFLTCTRPPWVLEREGEGKNCAYRVVLLQQAQGSNETESCLEKVILGSIEA